MARKKTISKQPRFTETQIDQGLYLDLLHISDKFDESPEYKPDTRMRDLWLSDFWRQEDHFQGVIHTMVSLDANRGWTLTGGRNQVMRYTGVLHDWSVAPGLKGWRPGVQAMSTSYLVTDFGGIAEIGRDGPGGPTRAFFHVDPTRCYLTGKDETPVAYVPRSTRGSRSLKDAIPFKESDFMRCVSMPEIKEEFRGAGHCFLSRAEVLVRLMAAIWSHDLEQLGAAAPSGLLLITGISETQWRNAMKGRKADQEAKNERFYNAVQVLANASSTVDAKLIALSNLPSGFNLQEYINMYMYSLASIAGYDPSEFYPVQYGALGRGSETEIQHEKASGKGGKNFSLALQEQLQRPDVLPEALHYETEERDEQAEIDQANVVKSWVDAFRSMVETGLQTTGIPGISNEEFRYLLADKGFIPPEWTEKAVPETVTDEDEEGTEEEEDASGDLESPKEQPKPEDESETRTGGGRQASRIRAQLRRSKRDRLLSLPYVWRAIDAFPREPLVRYSWSGDRPAGKIEVLWELGEDLLTRMSYPGIRLKKRADDSDILYDKGGLVITEGMVKQAIEEAKTRVGEEFAQILDNEPLPLEEEK